MTAVLLGTHTWAWSPGGYDRLSKPALAAISTAATMLLSPITFFEITQKIGIGEWPEMEPFIGELTALLAEQGGPVASQDQSICFAAGIMARTHRNPFDRLLAAMAAHYNLPLVSADSVFDGVVTRLW